MRRSISGAILAVALTLLHTDAVSQETRKFVRYEVKGVASYGRLEGSVILQMTGLNYRDLVVEIEVERVGVLRNRIVAAP